MFKIIALKLEQAETYESNHPGFMVELAKDYDNSVANARKAIGDGRVPLLYAKKVIKRLTK